MEQNNTIEIKTITIIGVGLIGGSIAAACKAARDDLIVRGIDELESTVTSGVKQGILQEGALPDDPKVEEWLSGKGSDLVIIATPVSGARMWLERLEAGGYEGILTDTASTKNVVCELAAETISFMDRYIPGHPMAGSEMSGIKAASPTLFQGAYWILCPDEDTDEASYLALHELIVSLGARVISISREDHDNAVAIVSHVPHMVASSLVKLSGEHSKKQRNLLRLAAGGFKDSTRIAAGSPDLWCGIAFDNSEAIADGLDEMNGIIDQFSHAIREHDQHALVSLLEESAEIRRNLPAKWVPDSSRLVECRIPMYNRSGVIAEVTTIASGAGCNIQSIDIDHISEDSAVLEMILTDEGDIGRLTAKLIDGGFDIAFRPLGERD